MEVIGDFRFETVGTENAADFGPIEIPEYHVFLLCDNRGNAVDSRIFGSVGVGSVNGRVKNKLWPRSSAGPVHERIGQSN